MRSFCVAAVLFLSFAVAAGAADDPVSLGTAITKGKISLNLRYRYEEVDQDGFDNKGKASTIRTTLAYRTLYWKGLSAFIEFEDVHDFGFSGEHNNVGAGSLWNGVRDYPVIADPEVTEFNQAYLDWRPVEFLPFRFGLQEIVVDNSRFIGNVGWRQNHQSFEAAKADFTMFDNFKANATYIGRAHTITGASQPMSTGYLEGSYTFGTIGTLRGYGLFIDYEQEVLWGRSTDTLGLSFSGKAKLSDRNALTYRLEFASQSEGGDNPNPVDADYLRADLGLKLSKVTLGAGYEVLGGSPGNGSFTTPLGTLHKFNGWADKFLATPLDGLQDLFLSVGAKVGKFNLVGVYHDFSADTGGRTWGSELDAHIVYTAPWKQKIALKYANYDADEWAADTQKIWIWTQWGF